MRIPREQQNIALSLIPIRMEMVGTFAQRVSQEALAKEYDRHNLSFFRSILITWLLP
jgi:hypothetical protein